jgi:hypothetical protein
MPLSVHAHFLWARALLGLYVCAHFLSLLPHAEELFSCAGMLPVATLSPFARAFPNVLTLYDAPTFVNAFVTLGAVAGAVTACGYGSRSAALVAYYVWACLFGRNPLIDNPSLPYVGLMLLVVASVRPEALKSGGPCAKRHRQLLWIAMSIGYSYSGLTKLSSASWIDGSALHYLLENPLARPSALRSALLSLPDGVLGLASFSTLALEVLFAPLALWARTRPFLWIGMLALHLSLIALVQFADLSLAMMLLHLFTFDPSWLQRRGAGRVRVLPGGQASERGEHRQAAERVGVPVARSIS